MARFFEKKISYEMKKIELGSGSGIRPTQRLLRIKDFYIHLLNGVN